MLIQYYYKKSNFSYNSNSILEGLLRNCSHEKTSKTMDARGEEPWRNILTSFRDTATRSNGIKVIRTKVRPISAGVSSMGDILGLFAGVAPSERRLTGNDTKIGSIWDLSILMRYRCMRILLWWLLCDGIICGPLYVVDGSPLYEDPTELRSADRPWWILHLRYGGNRTHAGTNPHLIRSATLTIRPTEHIRLILNVPITCDGNVWYQSYILGWSNG